jgi:RNA polymerase primary sigma factor
MSTNPLDQSLLETYLRKSNETLGAEEERQLIQRTAEGDMEARDRLVRAYRRLVASISRRYGGKGLGLKELLDVGNTALLRAVKSFEQRRGIKFSAFAIWWIRQSILRALADQPRTRQD